MAGAESEDAKSPDNRMSAIVPALNLNLSRSKSTGSFSNVQTWQFRWEDVYWSPDSRVKGVWDSIIAVLTFYSAFIVPVEVFILTAANLPQSIANMEVVVVLGFACDIVFSFFQPTRDEEGEPDVSHPAMCRAYLKGWFIPDFLATFPFTWLNFGTEAANLNLLRFLRVLRLARLAKVRAGLKKLLSNSRSLRVQGPFRVLDILVNICILAHYAGCFWVSVNERRAGGLRKRLDSLDGYRTLVAESDRLKETGEYLGSTTMDPFSMWLVGFMWAFNLITIGYSNPLAFSETERLMEITMTSLSVCVVALIVIQLNDLLVQINADSGQRESIVRMLVRALMDADAPTYVIEKLKVYMRTEYTRARQVQAVEDIIRELPESMALDIAMEVRGKWIARFSWLRNNLGRKFLAAVALRTRSEIFLNRDRVVTEGHAADSMLFLIKGTLRCFSLLRGTSRIPVNIPDWESFCWIGEAALFSPAVPRRMASLDAKTSSHVLAIFREDFDEIISTNAEWAHAVEEVRKEWGRRGWVKFQCARCQATGHGAMQCSKLEKQTGLERRAAVIKVNPDGKNENQESKAKNRALAKWELIRHHVMVPTRRMVIMHKIDMEEATAEGQEWRVTARGVHQLHRKLQAGKTDLTSCIRDMSELVLRDLQDKAAPGGTAAAAAAT